MVTKIIRNSLEKQLKTMQHNTITASNKNKHPELQSKQFLKFLPIIHLDLTIEKTHYNKIDINIGLIKYKEYKSMAITKTIELS